MATHAPAPETKAQTINRLLAECPLTLPTTTWTEIQRMLTEAYERGFQVGWETGQRTPLSERTYGWVKEELFEAAKYMEGVSYTDPLGSDKILLTLYNGTKVLVTVEEFPQ